MDLAIEALRLDASDFITKPLNTDTLLLSLQRARDRYTARRQVRDYMRLLERENVLSEQELHRQVAFRRNLIHSALEGIVGCDSRGRVLTFNRSMEVMLSRRQQEVIGVLFLEDLLTAEAASDLKERMESEETGGRGRVLLHETTLLDAEGNRVPVQVSATPVKGEPDETGIVFFFRDLRQLRLMEREMADQARILHQDKMMSLGRLAASVAHEINNPLAGILNYARLMLRVVGRRDPDAEQLERFRRYLELVEKETDRCSRIVSGLLTFSRREPPSRAAVRLGEVVRRSLDLSRHRLELGNIRLVVEGPDFLPTVRGDANQLQQCLINLIFNAIDAMPEGGTLTLRTGAGSPDGTLFVTVEDTGGGIRPEDVDHIFEPFFTTKDEGYGIGLGLATTFSILQQHGGDIAVDSRPGAGACFTMTLPADGGGGTAGDTP